VIQLAQATELGTCYSLDELRELRTFAQDNGLLTYIDGARIANAAAHLDCTLAEIAANADVLSFGGTKNGALGVEAVLVMTDGLADGARYHRKQQMQLASKMRFLGAQASALLADGLWLASASHANAMAARLAGALAAVPGVRIAYPVQANSVFTEVDGRTAQLLEKDFNIHVWSETDNDSRIVRWMTAFDTSAADVDQLAGAVETSIVSRET
jgi:threonine aldolase